MNPRTLRALIFAGMVAAAGGGAFWVARVVSAPPTGDEEDLGDEAEPESSALAPGERFEPVASSTRDVFETFPGRVSAGQGHPVGVPPGMRVAVVEIVKDTGDAVKKGDVLLRFNREEIERAIEKAKADGNDADLRRFRTYLDHADLRSPVDGIVSQVFTELGRVPVDAGHTALVEVADPSAFQLRVQVPSSLTKTVAHLGARLTADLDANLGRTSGTVTAYEDAPEGWVVLVVALDPREGYEPDLPATLRVPTSKQEVALVPKAAVTVREGVKVVRVWEPEDRSVGERTIATDGEEGGSFVVVAGVFPGENVVIPARR